MGEHNLTVDPDCVELEENKSCASPVQNIPVEKVIVHSSFNEGSTYSNDIALVRLASPAIQKGNFKIIKIKQNI